MIPFVLTVVAITLLSKPNYSDRYLVTEEVDSLSQILPATALIGYDILEERLIEVQSRVSATELGLSLDTTVVILLGGVGCSSNQVNLLHHWSDQHATTERKDHPY